jgi:hypothetical protein
MCLGWHCQPSQDFRVELVRIGKGGRSRRNPTEWAIPRPTRFLYRVPVTCTIHRLLYRDVDVFEPKNADIKMRSADRHRHIYPDVILSCKLARTGILNGRRPAPPKPHLVLLHCDHPAWATHLQSHPAPRNRATCTSRAARTRRRGRTGWSESALSVRIAAS